MTTRIKLRRDTAANWLQANPILAAGEPGLETDTGKVKYGDGVTAYANLPHAGGDTLDNEGGVVVTTGSTNYWVAAQRREGKDIYGRGVRYDSEGNAYTLTETQDDADTVTVITKYSPAGALLWQHSIDDAQPTALAVDSNDNAYIAMESGDSNAHLIKFAANGQVLWKKEYDAGQWQGEAFIEERTSERLAMTLNRQDGGADQVLVLDISMSTGDVSSEKILVNGSDNMYAQGIDTDGDGNIFVSGRYFDSDDEKYKLFIEKLDGDLNRVWSKSVETDNTNDMDAGDCASDDQGNVYVVAYYGVATNDINGNNTQTAGILIKLNSSGVIQWSRRMGPGPCNQYVAGLTATDTGDVYLVTSTLEFKTDDPQLDQYDQFAQGTARMMVAKFDTSGNVTWQRYVDAEHVWENNDQFRGQAIAVHNNKFIVDFYGNRSNTIPWNFSGTADDEDDYYLVQLPADGTELQIGEVAFRESYIPGRFYNFQTSASPTTNETLEGNVVVATSNLTLDPVARISNAIVNSQSYDYVFGPDGTLTIPNDGDIKLTQNQLGYLAVIGDTVNYNNDTWGRAVTADSEGNMYVVGEDSDRNSPAVVKISPEGLRLWSVTIEENARGNNGRANGVALVPTNGNVAVACEFYDNYVYSTVVVIDQHTGRIISTVEFKDDTTDIYLNDITFQSDGGIVVGGSKNGNFADQGPYTAEAGSTNQKLVLLRSTVTGTPDTNWQIGGTGFSVYENIAAVEQWSNLTSTTDAAPGSGAEISVRNVGDGTYNVGTVPVAGSGYQVGRFLKVLGDAVGGATPANDLIVKVTTVDGDGGITGVEIFSGTAGGTTDTTYPSVPVSKIAGSGFTLTSFSGPLYSNQYADYQTYSGGNPGLNYAVGDVIRFAGTQLGGTAPANDLLYTVTGVDGNGSVQNWSISGTAQSTTWNIITTTNVDFSQPGTWSFSRPLSRENLLISDGWMRTYGTNTGDYTDRTYAVAVDSDNNIITATQGYGVTGEGQRNNLAVVYKFNSAGTLLWAKQLNELVYGAEAKSVTTIGQDIYATHYSYDDGDTVITKLAADGVVKWQRRIDSGSDSSIIKTSDGNLVVVAEAWNEDIYNDAIKLFKMNPNGETVYKRWLLADTTNDTRFKNGRALYESNGSIFITSYYYADDYDSWFVAKLPLDGSGTGEYSQFRYMDTNPMDGSYNYPGLNSAINYLVGEIGGSYAGDLDETPFVNTDMLDIIGQGDYFVDSYYPSYFREEIRDMDGGNIIFPDGTKQNTSATDTPQRLYTGPQYTLGMMDRGHHIYCQDQNRNILIPYDARVPFPIGTTITIVNDTGTSVYVATEGGGTNLLVVGNGNYGGAEIFSNGVAILIKIQREKWVIYGSVNPW